MLEAHTLGMRAGTHKWVCIRPQHITLVQNANTTNQLQATLTSIRWQGDLTHLICDVAGETVSVAITHLASPPKIGDKLTLWFSPVDTVLIEE